MRVDKYSDKAVKKILQHNARELPNMHNTDKTNIKKSYCDTTRSGNNIIMTPSRLTASKKGKFYLRPMSNYEYYRKTLSTLHQFKRKGANTLNTLCEWVLHMPSELKDAPAEIQQAFWQSTHDFLCDRYQGKYCISSVVHRDEGLPNAQKHNDHLHWNFIPAVINKKGTGGKAEKVSAKEAIGGIAELKEFYKSWQSRLNNAGIVCKVTTGKTKAEGRRSLPTSEYKKMKELEREVERLQEQKRLKLRDRSREQEGVFINHDRDR
jgi:hypothetical protein